MSDREYVGKANPPSNSARTPRDQGLRLYNRLKDHLRSIRHTSGTLSESDFDCRSLVVQSGWQDAAETYKIQLFQPAWNNETGICFGIGKHGDSASTRANKRSPWDTLHPGRPWASDFGIGDARSKDQILPDLDKHFTTSTIHLDMNQILQGFVEVLRQL